MKPVNQLLGTFPRLIQKVCVLRICSSVYDCTVKYWRVDDEKARNATLIIGCYKGIVKEVVKITEPYKVDADKFPGRKVFAGIELPDSPYMGMDIRTIFDTLANFNTKYYNL